MGNLPKISPITDEELDRINEKFGMDVDFSRRIGMRLTEAQKAMQENERLKRRIEELEQRLKAGQHETIVMPPLSSFNPCFGGSMKRGILKQPGRWNDVEFQSLFWWINEERLFVRGFKAGFGT